MKNKNNLIISLILVLILSINIDAKTTEKINETPQNSKKISFKSRPVIDIEVDDFFEFKYVSLQKIDGIYYIYNTILHNHDVKETITNDTITLEYKDEDYNILKSVYKKIDNSKGYAHIKNIIINKSEDDVTTTTYNFRYSLTKYVTTSDLKSANATNDYDLTNLIVNSVSSDSKRDEIKYYNTNAKHTINYYYSEYYEYEKNVRYLFSKLYFKKQGNDILAIVNQYNPSKKLVVKEIFTFKNAVKDYQYAGEVYDSQSFDYQKTYKYNSKGKLVSYSIYINGESYSVDIHNEYITYYSNGKVKQKIVYKRNLKYEKTTSSKISYRSNGKKYSYKIRTYKNDKLVKQKYYRYNKNGLLKKGAYRKTVLYNKSKAYKAYSNTYSSRGKISKAKTIKITKNLSKW